MPSKKKPLQSCSVDSLQHFEIDRQNHFRINCEKDPLITIITVVFNGEEAIERTIKSVLSQDYSNIEYIIIDGCSTDLTLDKISKYSSQIDYWISEPDSGIYDAMNKGVKLAKGKWINFMNCGDTFISNNIISDLRAMFVKTGSLIISGNVRIVSTNGEDTGKKHPYNGTNYRELIKYNCVAHQASFINKKVFELVGGFSEKYKIHGDYDLWIRSMVLCVEFIYINKFIANFCNDGISSKRDSVPLAIREKYEILKDNHLISNLEFYLYSNFDLFLFKIKTLLRFLLVRG